MSHLNLSAKQDEELRLSILDYLRTSGMTKSFEALASESGLSAAYQDDGKQKYSGLLEKKWTSVIRLQKKVELFMRMILRSII